MDNPLNEFYALSQTGEKVYPVGSEKAGGKSLKMTAPSLNHRAIFAERDEMSLPPILLKATPPEVEKLGSGRCQEKSLK